MELASDTAIDIAQVQPNMYDQIKNNEKFMDMMPFLEQKSAYSSENKWIDLFIGGEDAVSYAKGSNQFGQILFVPSDSNPNYYVAQPMMLLMHRLNWRVELFFLFTKCSPNV